MVIIGLLHQQNNLFKTRSDLIEMKRIVFLFFLLILITACSQTAWTNNSFNEVKNEIDSVTIVFPQIKYFEIFGEKKYLQRGKSIYVANNIASILKELIESRKFITCKNIMYTDSLIIEKWLAKNFHPSLKDTLKNYDTLIVNDENKHILRFSNEMKDLTDGIKSKYIFYIKGIAFGTAENTKHGDMIQMQTFKLFYGNNYAYNFQWNGLKLEIFLLDLKTGEILWHNSNKDDDSKYESVNRNDSKRLLAKILEIE